MAVASVRADGHKEDKVSFMTSRGFYSGKLLLLCLWVIFSGCQLTEIKDDPTQKPISLIPNDKPGASPLINTIIINSYKGEILNVTDSKIGKEISIEVDRASRYLEFYGCKEVVVEISVSHDEIGHLGGYLLLVWPVSSKGEINFVVSITL